MSNKTSVLILENIRSVENTASIFRSASSFNVSKVILIGTTPAPLDRFGRIRQDFAKISLGAEKLISWEATKSISSTIEELREQGFQIISLEQDPKSVRLKDFKTSDQFALIVGNEVTGVSKEVLETSDAIVEIPMSGSKESLNVAVATGIALFHLC
ncbi:MAG TPA: TrmH family RNA methyltransferase [Candidatus Paceibacterota bacterium]